LRITFCYEIPPRTAILQVAAKIKYNPANPRLNIAIL
jgi:hypothetical protein